MFFMWSLVCFFIAFVVITQSVKYATTWRLIDLPNCERKKHAMPTPLVGGLALFSAVILSFAYLYVTNSITPLYFILSASVIFVVGVLDDMKGLCAYKRLLIQVSVAFYMLVNDPQLYLGVASFLPLEHIAYNYGVEIIAAFFIVGTINAFNLIDGIDGLAGSLALVSMMSIAYLSSDQMPFVFVSATFLSISILVYLCFNLELFGKTKKIFFGDSGSTILGLALSWMVLKLVANPNVAVSPSSGLFLIMVPLLDTLCVICRRLSQGKSPFSPDRMHMHHMLMDVGFTKKQTVAILGVISLLFASLVVFQLSLLFYLLALLIFLSLYLVVLMKLSAHEKFVFAYNKKLKFIEE